MKIEILDSTAWSQATLKREQVMVLDQVLGELAWSSLAWQKLSSQSLLFMTGSPLQAFALYEISQAEELAHLLKIVVAESYQGSQLSADFWREQVSELKKRKITRIYLEVESHNHRARGFYQKHGFKMLREAKRFYLNGADAIIMELAI